MTRRELADAIDDLDRQIGDLQTDKRELFKAYREALGKEECNAAKAAIKRRQLASLGKEPAIDAHEHLTAEIYLEITDPAQRATRSTDYAIREEAA